VGKGRPDHRARSMTRPAAGPAHGKVRRHARRR
jgi:hypothetical protein